MKKKDAFFNRREHGGHGDFYFFPPKRLYIIYFSFPNVISNVFNHRVHGDFCFSSETAICYLFTFLNS
jgi:hypothetical protein